MGKVKTIILKAQTHDAEWKKADTEEPILHGSIYAWNSRKAKSTLQWQKADQGLPGAKGTRELFGVEMFYIHRAGGNMGAPTCENAPKCTLYTGKF